MDNRRGQTLLEVLVAMTVLTILSIGTSLLYVQSLRMYQRGGREATSRDKASLALEHILPELRDAFNVEYPGPSSIVLTEVAKDANGDYVVDTTARSLVSGNEVILYRSDAQGTIEEFVVPPPPVDPEEEDPDPPDPDAEPELGYRGVPGSYVWRAERSPNDGVWSEPQLITDGVENLTFAYSPTEEALELVCVAVTVGQGAAPGYFNRTEVAAVKVRNH
jgi:prepilin-type N-terminal cleavage/methylation domain-containing protein